MILTIGEIIKRFRTEGRCFKFCPQTIVYMADKLGYEKKRVGGKIGYDQSLITAITRHFNEAVEYDNECHKKMPQKPLKQPNMGDYYTYNGERDNIDYEWEKNENKNMILYTRNNRKIYIAEDQVSLLKGYFLNEGVVFKKNEGEPPIDTSITPIKFGDKSSTDIDNTVADTRFFGTKNDILYGDNTLSKRTYSLSDLYHNMNILIAAYESAIKCIESGNRFNPVISQCPSNTYSSIIRKMGDKSLSDEELIDYFNERIYVFKKQYDMSKAKYDRTMNADDGSKLLPRYDVGVVPGTDVKVIALFKFNDFNFSDAIKNGELRQTKGTDDILNITPSERETNSKLYGKGKGTNKKLKTSYDNGTVTPDIATNFSLNANGNDKFGFGDDHYKQQFKSRGAYNSDAEFNADSKQVYNSVTQFMDKSILAARYALKNEGVKVDYILAAPSSSKYNHYYCVNLSRKLGIEYKPDFFSRNLINVQLDEGIYKAGLTTSIIENTKNLIKEAAITEISSLLMKDVKAFVKENYVYLSNISKVPHGREKIDADLVCEFIKHYSYYGLCNIHDSMPKTSNVYMYLVNHFMDYVEIKQTKKDIDVNWIWKSILFVLKTKLSRKYQELLANLDRRIKICSNYLKAENGGWKLSYCKKFKITDIDIKARPYVKNAYVVSDSELDAEDNLFEKYRNANFLMVDEDMNSGGTLKLLIEALKDQVVGHIGKRGRRGKIKSTQITCLVNAYTLK